MRRISRLLYAAACAAIIVAFANASQAQVSVFSSAWAPDATLRFGGGVFSSALHEEGELSTQRDSALLWTTEDELSELVWYDDEEEARLGVYGACLDEPVLYRGQSDAIPPVESPSRTTIGESSIFSSTTNVTVPPVVGNDRPFEPVQAQTTSESTTLQKVFKNSQNISGSYLFMPRGKKNGLGVNEIEARLLFAFPCKAMQNLNSTNNGYFLLTPSFVYDNFSLSHTHNSAIKLPTNVFDAGLTTSFMTAYNDLEAKVDFSIGVASSFKKIHGKAIYYRGRAEISLAVDNDKRIRALGGVEYLDRIRYKLVPIFGVKWNPNEQNVFRLVFPNPEWYHFLTKVNETDWWFFLKGDIGGGRWYMSDLDAPVRGKTSYNVDYNDYRFGGGVAFDCSTRLKGSFEVGGAFKRELRTKFGKEYAPRNSVYLKVGLFY